MSWMTIFLLEKITHLNEIMTCSLIMIYNGSAINYCSSPFLASDYSLSYKLRFQLLTAKDILFNNTKFVLQHCIPYSSMHSTYLNQHSCRQQSYSTYASSQP